jgi:IS30 family transposase
MRKKPIKKVVKYVRRDRKGGGSLQEHLRHGGRKYRGKTSKRAGVDCIPNRTDISERPAIVDEKLRIGDWEGDSASCKTKPAEVGVVFT